MQRRKSQCLIVYYSPLLWHYQCYLAFIYFLLVPDAVMVTWEPKAMQQAIDTVKKNGIAWQTAATRFNGPKSTLKRPVVNKNQHATGNKQCLGRYRAVFNERQEQELV